ncbi:jg22055 [Pararge aegeria aegeria]|uniref:Jg22055 protein n=1 Tax=Pararge aegeria aegeria TaxID=348720 RepID=A0A8S4RPT0_9NEOP|nr:jg22055 [Pararge aegeria aegeria]
MAADTGMDTCPSPEITDSRKRPLDGDSENGDVKRSHFSSVQDLVTALPLANGHSNITSHFGESSESYYVRSSLALWFLVARMPRARSRSCSHTC